MTILIHRQMFGLKGCFGCNKRGCKYNSGIIAQPENPNAVKEFFRDKPKNRQELYGCNNGTAV